MYLLRDLEPKPITQITSEGDTIDMFLRNFFIQHKMTETLNNFQQEWYESLQKGVVVQGI